MPSGVVLAEAAPHRELCQSGGEHQCYDEEAEAVLPFLASRLFFELAYFVAGALGAEAPNGMGVRNVHGKAPFI